MAQFFETIILIFGLFAWSRSFLRYRSRDINFGEFTLWTIIWGGLILIVLASTPVYRFGKLFGTGRPIDVIVYSSIILLFYLLFRVFVKLETVEKNMTKITREIALKKK
ncbi:DUF2304 family protein [Candidatus Woesearchaeota archaeon]|nr:DUF2304 family protein [Candidatus Woesearchaeota archaeon]